MAQDDNRPSGTDLIKGVESSALAEDGMLVGRVGEDEVLLVRRAGRVFAVSAHCTHYHGPLADGLVVAGTLRCPWHHACFDLDTGEALAAPALAPLVCYDVVERGGRIVVTGKKAPPRPPKAGGAGGHVVIVGGGAAGFAAAEMLRRRGFSGRVTMISNDGAAPVDRPNLSKDYLAGTAPEDWVPLRDAGWYAENEITVKLNTAAVALDAHGKRLRLGDGSELAFDKLLLATGAEPVRLAIPGADREHVHVLRSLADCRAIIADAQKAKRAVVVGASFIGLEVAASLRTRGLDVHVVAPEQRPLERVFGPQLGDFIRALHESHGVRFRLGNTLAAIAADHVTLKNGETLAAELVVIGVGVRPRVGLAEKAGLAVDGGVLVNEWLETSTRDVYAAGDIARWPDPISGERIRVEHWVVAERQGQIAARNMMGERSAFRAVPFFWSQHYDVPINYVGHAPSWDDIAVDGSIEGRDCLLRYKKAGRVLAVASIYRDRDCLRAAAEMEAAAAA